MNLYVDDLRECPYEGWITARTSAAAKEWLKAGAVEQCSLDHDLGACESCQRTHADVGDMQTPETTFFSWCEHGEDGTKLVYWMIETGYWPKFKPTVHSANPVGAHRMRGMIDRYWPGKFHIEDIERDT